MESSERTKSWASKVRKSYDQQLADGATPPLLPEDLLWQTPGVDNDGMGHLVRLSELGITTKFNLGGIQLVPVDSEVVDS